MTMNPDIKDPVWIEQRETQWKALQAFLKSSIRRTELMQWRKVFFGEEEFEYRNKRKYGENDLNYYMGFVVYPIQTPERWSFLIKEQYPKWWIKEKAFLKYLTGLIQSISNLGGDLNRWGWDVKTQVEVFRFMLGERYVNGQYDVCGHSLKYPFSASWIHNLWLEQIDFWLTGSIAFPDVRGRHLLGYWKSCLTHLHPWFFEPRLLRNWGVKGPQWHLKSLMAFCTRYDLDAMKAHCRQENSVEMIDCGERQVFLNELKILFETADLPEPMQRLWKMAKAEKDFGPESHGEMPENEDPSLLLEHDEFNKAILGVGCSF